MAQEVEVRHSVTDLADRIEEAKRNVLQTLYPPSQKRHRTMPHVTRLRRGEDLRFVRARIFFRIMEFVRRGDRIDWRDIDPVTLLEDERVSEGGKGRAEAVQIAQWFPQEERSGGLLGRRRR